MPTWIFDFQHYQGSVALYMLPQLITSPGVLHPLFYMRHLQENIIIYCKRKYAIISEKYCNYIVLYNICRSTDNSLEQLTEQWNGNHWLLPGTTLQLLPCLFIGESNKKKRKEIRIKDKSGVFFLGFWQLRPMQSSPSCLTTVMPRNGLRVCRLERCRRTVLRYPPCIIRDLHVR